MKKRFYILIVIIVGVLVCVSVFLLANIHRHGILVINEAKIADTPTVVYAKGYSAVPVVRILKELGFEVDWQNDTTAKITGYGHECQLDLEAMTLMCPQTVDSDDPDAQLVKPEIDLLSLKSGENVYIKERAEHDVLVDDQIMRIALERLGFQAVFHESFFTGQCILTVTYP